MGIPDKLKAQPQSSLNYSKIFLSDLETNFKTMLFCAYYPVDPSRHMSVSTCLSNLKGNFRETKGMSPFSSYTKKASNFKSTYNIMSSTFIHLIT